MGRRRGWWALLMGKPSLNQRESTQRRKGQARPVTESAREVIYFDPAYTLVSIKARGQLNFIRSRDRGGYFSFVWGVHPFVGLLENRWAGRIRRERFDERQVVFDGFVEGRPIPKALIPLSVFLALCRLFVAIVPLAWRKEVKAIYSADLFGCGLIALLVSRLSGKPLLVASYVNQDENWEANRKLISPRLLPTRRLEQFVSRAILKRAVLVEAPTENMRNYVVANGADPETIVTLPVAKLVSDVHFSEPGERPDAIPFLQSRGVPNAPIYLLCVGRLLVFKFPDDAVRAMTIVIRQNPGVIGLLAGEGDMAEALQAEIGRSAMSGKIFLLGDCDQPTLAAIAPHCITLSPLTGLALIETSLGGSPPVAYDRDWQPEFIADNHSGFIVPFRDHEAMAARASLLVRDDELRQRLGQQARENALEFAHRPRTAARERAAISKALDVTAEPDQDHILQADGD